MLDDEFNISSAFGSRKRVFPMSMYPFFLFRPTIEAGICTVDVGNG